MRPSRVAIAHRWHVAKYVGDRQAAFADATVEVFLVAFMGFAAIEPAQVFVGELALAPPLGLESAKRPHTLR